MALRQCGFLLCSRDILEYVAAATGIEVAAVVAGALYTHDIGGWRRIVDDVVGDTRV